LQRTNLAQASKNERDAHASRADEDHLWCWSCRFDPTAELRECPSGIAADFDQARAELEKAWRVAH
jgi:hypothetical protein